MKTHTFKLKSLFYIGLAVVALVACNKKDDSSGNLATTPQGYNMINGTCYNNMNQPVANTYCMNNGYYLNNGICYAQNGQAMPNTSYCSYNNNGGYYMNNGYCYAQNGQVVASNYCQNTGYGNNGYYMANGYCYASNGQMVSTTFCQNYGGNGMMGQQCYGSYLYQSGYWSQMVWCNGTNCRGYTLYEINTNRSVVCQ